MKVFVVLATLLVAAFAATEDFCYKDALGACSTTTKSKITLLLISYVLILIFLFVI